VGKRTVYVYKAQKKVAKGGGEKTRVRTIWGRITRVHGNSGAVRAKVSCVVVGCVAGCDVMHSYCLPRFSSVTTCRRVPWGSVSESCSIRRTSDKLEGRPQKCEG